MGVTNEYIMVNNFHKENKQRFLKLTGSNQNRALFVFILMVKETHLYWFQIINIFKWTGSNQNRALFAFILMVKEIHLHWFQIINIFNELQTYQYFIIPSKKFRNPLSSRYFFLSLLFMYFSIYFWCNLETTIEWLIPPTLY